jgi:hypothetical protein
MLVEVAYISLIVKNFLVLKYLISSHLFISKLTQAVFLLIFHCLTLQIYLKNGQNSPIPPSKLVQSIGMWCLIIAVVFEYLFLIINIVWIVRELLKKRK